MGKTRKMHLMAYLKTGPTAQHTAGGGIPRRSTTSSSRPVRIHRPAAGDRQVRRLLLRRPVRPLRHPRRQLRRHRPARRADQLPRSDGGAAGDGARRRGISASAPRCRPAFHSAYQLARWLASLDVMSKGRVAWNVVTSASDLEARNAGLDELPPRDLRYDRADEVLEACFALWNSWEEDALVLDKEAACWPIRRRSTTRTTRALDQDARAALDPAQPAGPSGDHAGRQLRPRPRLRRALGRDDLHPPALRPR